MIAGGVLQTKVLDKLKRFSQKKNNFNSIFSDIKFCGDNAAMMTWADSYVTKKLINNLNEEPKSRWPLDETAKL